MENEYAILEVNEPETANIWRPVDYEMLNKQSKYTNWLPWNSLCQVAFLIAQEYGGRN
jgi:hypothetical protein